MQRGYVRSIPSIGVLAGAWQRLSCVLLAERDGAVQRRVAVVLASVHAHPRLLNELPDEPEEAALRGPVQDGLAAPVTGEGARPRGDEQVASGGATQISGVMRNWSAGVLT